jgi:type I restriction enzyme S subunit
VKIEKKSEIRFSKFKEDWQEYKLGEVYTERKEKGQDSLPILSVSIHKGISDGELDTDSLGKSVVRSEDKSLYKHVYPGDLVLNMMRAWQGAYGVVTSEGMVSPAYITAIPSNQIFPPFMDYCLRRDEMIAQINNLSYGVTDFRKRLYWKSFIKILCHIPSIPVQKKITSFLTKLDKSISIHRQELDTLKQTKQGFSQKMFPKEGESVPEIRFKGFSENWKEYRLSDLGDTFTGLSGLTKEDFGTGNGKYVTYMNVFANAIAKVDSKGLGVVNIANEKKQNRVTKGDLLFTTSSETPEEVGMVSYWGSDEDNVFLNSFCFGFKVNLPEIDTLFMAYLLRSSKYRTELNKLAQGSTRYNLSKTELLKLMVGIPSLEEQKKISFILQKLEEIIALHQQELEALQQTKKAFLQKMFV